MFTKAERTNAYIKLAITGPAGSGKTYSALRLARGLVGPKGRIAFIDTENESATLYSDLTEFFHCNIEPPFEYHKFIDATKEAEKAGFGCIIIDSASHLWKGILEHKTKIDLIGGNQFTNWAKPSKNFDDTIQTFLQSKIHTISCMRTKMEYVLEDSINAKGQNIKVPRTKGLAPIMRDGIEYEFTTIFNVGITHECDIAKDRTGLFTEFDKENQKTFQITEETGEMFVEWLSRSVPKVTPPKSQKAETVEWLNVITELIQISGDSEQGIRNRLKAKHGKELEEYTIDEIKAFIRLFKHQKNS